MRLVRTDSVRENVILGKPVYNDRGQVLLNEGVTLSKRMIEKLVGLGVTFVYIDDDDTKNIEIHGVISDQTKREANDIIKNMLLLSEKEQDIHKVFLGERFDHKFKQVIQSILGELKENDQVVSLLSDVYTVDNYVLTHSLNVTIYSLALAYELKLPDKRIEEVGLGAILHDVGKMLTPKDILFKPGSLTNSEFAVIKQHAEDGFQLLKNLPNIPLVAAHCAYQHHERLNGSGYPRGITQKEIHLYGKILAIADVFDAVTSNRVYRKAMLPHEGLEILYAGAGTLFEQDMVEAFRKAIAAYPNGLTVKLSDGRKGVVAKQNKHLSDRPIVRILKHDNEKLLDSYDLDLSKVLDIVIVDCDLSMAEN